MYIKRAIEDTVIKVSSMFPVILLTGPRQAGKTTLLQNLAEENRKYLTLDDPDIRYLAKQDPALFLQRYTPPILIDEIQYATELLPYIKMYVDRTNRNGDIWLTSSQVFHPMNDVSEILLGHIGFINLLGLSDAEIYHYDSRPFSTNPDELMKRADKIMPRKLTETYDRIFRGSMPALYADETIDQKTYYRSYLDTYFQRDIRDLVPDADKMSFFHFMTVVAAHTSKYVTDEELANAAGISAPTAKKWLAFLISSHIITLVHPYRNNALALKRIDKMPLLYFLDTGLAAYLLQLGNSEALEKGAMSDAFFESYVFSEIFKSYLNAGKGSPFCYYRDKDQKESTLLLYKNNTLTPIEIQKVASPEQKAIKNFKFTQPKCKKLKVEIGTGIVICMAQDLLPLDGQNWYVPA